MAQASPDVSAALATLRDRWGAAAPRRLGFQEPAHGAVVGSLATVPLPSIDDTPDPDLVPDPHMVPDPDILPFADPAAKPLPHRPAQGSLVPGERIVPTGFATLDALLGTGGVPRQSGLALRGDHSSGKTTLALRLVAEAQATGAIVAWLDLARSLDPVEAVARGVNLEWLVVLVPENLEEGLAMAGSLLQGQAVDLLVADLPIERGSRGGRTSGIADRFHRLAALARRSETLLVVLEPPGLSGSMSGALIEMTGLRLELARRSWIRLGRDVVGQRTEVTVARNRFGPPGRHAEIEILYADGGERDACLARNALLHERRPTAPPGHAADRTGPEPALVKAGGSDPSPPRPTARPGRSNTADAPAIDTIESFHASSPSPLAASPPPPRQVALHVLPAGTRRPGRPAVDGGHGPRREPGRPGARRSTGDATRQRTSAGA